MISCPVCKKEKDIDYGNYICSECNSKFEFQTNGKVEIIKRNKFDYWIFFISLIFPMLFFALLVFDTARINFYINQKVFSGLLMIFYPLLITLRQLFFQGPETKTLIALYFRFFKNELKKEDIGRIVGFYLTFITNFVGVIWILITLIK